MTISVVIVDDQALVRAGLRTVLSAEDDIDVIGEAADGAEAIELVRSTNPQVAVMDVRMPLLDGIAATRRLTADAPATRVLILTTYDIDEYVFDALAAGASGFLLKYAQPEEIVAAIRIIAAGDALLAPSATRRLIAEFAQRPARPAASTDVLTALTPREADIMRLLARGRSNAEIAGELFLSGNTVRTHVAHVLNKLGVRDRVQAVILAYESGIVTPGG